MMVVITESGSRYEIEARSTKLGMCLFASKNGGESHPVVGIFEDRLPHLLATVRLAVTPRGVIVGYNARNRETFKFIPTQLKVGMILANRHGLRSTPIVAVFK